MAFLNAEYELRAVRRVSIHPVFVAVMLVLFCGGLSFAIEADQDFFEKEIRPLLVEKCWKCHGAEKQDGGLRLDSAEWLARGGKSGPVSQPNNSLLIQAARQTDSLKSHPEVILSNGEIGAFVRWVAAGVFWPQVSDGVTRNEAADGAPLFNEQQKSFWAFQKLQDPPPPEVQEDGTPISPLDRFILARLQATGFQLAPPAGKQTLIRRVTFNLTGLPPTLKEIDAFLEDESAVQESFAKVVDRLLESPHYGERWARRWLDIVRYADTTGAGGQVVMRFAHRYRDYVIRAFNEDKPYDQFVIEQLAGDLMPATQDLDVMAQRVIATGFLMVGQKEISEPDKVKTVLDIVDDQIDVTSRTFLGLTVACARCHDHKFDPIPTLDYYAMAGIFNSTSSMPHLDIVSMWQEYPLFQQPGQEEPFIVMAAKDGEPANMHVLIRGNHHTPGEEAPRRFLQIIAGENHPPIETQQSGRLELGRWIASPENPLTARVMVNRIWQAHFGTGLVDTSDNFGVQGSQPSHPRLLDWLASRFIESGWSIKAMHRLILNSATYRQSSHFPDTPSVTPPVAETSPVTLDPQNRLLWRFPRRRLEAEELRDGILAISGQLDYTFGGSLLDYGYRYLDSVIDKKRGQYGLNLGGRTYQPYYSLRRSIYLPVIREGLAEILERFDAADPNAITVKRNQSTVAPQALFMMNNSLVRQQSFHLARQLLKQPDASSEDRVRQAYRTLFATAPSQQELAEAVEYMSQYSQQLERTGRAADIGYPAGSRLTFTIHRAAHNASLQPGVEKILKNPDGVRLRLSATTVDRQRANRDLKGDWIVLQPDHVAATSSATLAIQPDGSLYLPGNLSVPDVYTMVAETSLTGITGFRLEVLPDPSGQPGRTLSDLFTLNQFEVSITPSDDRASPRQIILQNVTGKMIDHDLNLPLVIDGDPTTKWPIGPEQDRPQGAIFEVEDPKLAPWQSFCRALFCSNRFVYLE